MANAASDPRTTAATADRSATWIDSPIASRTDGLSQAEPNHCVLNSRIGHTWIRWALNAYRAMIAIGRYRKASTNPDAARRSQRAITAPRTLRAGERLRGRYP